MINLGQLSYEYKTDKSMYTDMGTTNEVNSLVWLRLKQKFEVECVIDRARIIKPTITETKLDGYYLIQGVSDIVLDEEQER